MKFIPELAGLRGLAATMVFVAHSAIDGFLPKFIANAYGKTGLMCFFMLSGYLIAQVYLYKPFTKETSRNYLIARLARIVPLYLLVIIASFIISNYIFTDFHYDFRDKTKFLLSLLFINCPYEPWTIPVEVQFYFCFLLFWFLYATKKLNLPILFLLPIILLIPSVVYGIMFHKIPHVMGSFSIFFFIGILISVLHSKNYFEKLKTTIPSFISWLALLAFAIVFPLVRKKLGMFAASWYDPFALLTVSFLFILVITKPGDFKLLTLRPFIFMSEISYGFYLIHRPIMKITIDKFGTHPLTGVVLFIVCITLAWFCFKLIEVPARKFIENKLNS